MEIHDYFDPVTVKTDYRLGEKNVFGAKVQKNLSEKSFPDWQKADIALVGISEYRQSRENNSADTANKTRKYLYELSKPEGKINVTDLGNLKVGNTIEDSCAALRDIMSALLERNIFPVLIGGTSQLALAMFKAYENNQKTINLTSIDRQPGLAGNHFDDSPEQSYLGRIISEKSRFLFNYANIGYQSYFTLSDEIKLLDDLLFDAFRLGVVRDDIREMEPVLRDTDMLVISMSAVRQSDAPAAITASPNGFTGEEICQLAWYGGKSERLTSIAFHDWYHEYDRRDQTSHLAAQVIWYFIDGYYRRKGEYPFNTSRDSTKYIVDLSGPGTEIVFYKSTRSERWWMEIPSSKLPRSLLVACSYEDYQKACRQEVPDRWWQNFKKINH
jgi:formiminoglutamase